MDAKKLLLDTFDKLALAFAAIVFAAFVASSVLQKSPADEAREKVNDYNKKIGERKRIAEDRAPKVEPLRDPENVLAALRGGAEGVSLPEWLFYKRPVVTVRTKSETGPEPKHFAPTDVKGAPGLGKIAISWSESPRNAYVAIERYKIWRAEGKAEDWKEIGNVDGKAHSFVDRDVQSGTAYFYKVESIAAVDRAHPQMKRYPNVDLDPADVAKMSDPTEGLRTKNDTLVEVMSATAKDIPSGIFEARAFLKVWRYFTADQRWFDSSPAEYKVGEKVGKKEGFGKDVKDFTTEYTVADIAKKDIERAIGQNKVTIAVVVVKLKDGRTGDVIEISQEEPDPEFAKVKKNPKEGGDDGDSAETPNDGKSGKDKSKPRKVR